MKEPSPFFIQNIKNVNKTKKSVVTLKDNRKKD